MSSGVTETGDGGEVEMQEHGTIFFVTERTESDI